MLSHPSNRLVVKIIMVGDFCQLPPIVKTLEGRYDLIRTDAAGHPQRNMPMYWVPPAGNRKGREEILFTNRGFAFQSSLWWELDLHIIELKKVHRQSDQKFVDTLKVLRQHTVGDGDQVIKGLLDWLNTRFYKHRLSGNLLEQPLHLFPCNNEVCIYEYS